MALDSVCREVHDPARLPPLDDLLEGLREPFVSWLDSECTLSPRFFGGMSCLHLSFCEWMIARNEVPCGRASFEALLSESGFLIGDVEGTQLVSGLILRTDIEPHWALQGGSQ
jgi:hypothetical protein